MNLISNIINNYNYLRQDYIDFHLDKLVIYNLIINLLISVSLILIFYLIGSKIKLIILKKENYSAQEIFIKIAFGYIFIGSGLAIIGFFSLLYTQVIIGYLLLCVLLAFLPINSIKNNLIEIRRFIKGLYRDFKNQKWIFIWITLFIFIGFIKLISPEIREDQYHTDLPIQYLKSHTTMLPSREGIMVSASPQLGEMSYLIAIFLGSKEAVRYIHFIFYILVLLLLYSLSKDKKYKFAIIAPLLFATAPEVIHETSAQYTDFQWIFLFLLSAIILTKNKSLNPKLIALSGLIFGGMIATKLWTIPFIFVPVFYILLFYYKTKTKAIMYIFTFILYSLLVPFIWFFRSFILTGSPVYPAFTNREILEGTVGFGLLDYIVFNSALFRLSILKIFSPLFFLGIVTFLYRFKNNLNDLRRYKLFIFFVLLFILYTFINYPYGRYLLGLYSIAIIIASIGLYRIISTHKFFKYLISMVLFLLFFYYFLNSILVLPYGIGIADKNKYLTRTLSRDNSSYYDFDRQFDKHISKTDLVATYGFGHYYADFNYIDINYILDRKILNFENLKNKNVTKLFIKGGDINWFCNKLNLTNCKQENYELLSKYSAVPHSGNQYYLYSIK